MEKWTLIAASAIFATQNNKLNPCAPCSFKSEVLLPCIEVEGGADAMIQAIFNQYVFWMCIVLRVLFSYRLTSSEGALTGWCAAWEGSDDGQAEHKPREQASGTVQSWLHGTTTIHAPRPIPPPVVAVTPCLMAYGRVSVAIFLTRRFLPSKQRMSVCGPHLNLRRKPLNAKKAELHEVIRLSLAGYVRLGAEKRGFGR
jgi:hypothetical protein